MVLSSAPIINPTRPVDWRWQLAVEHVASAGRPFRRLPDRWTREAVLFWGGWHGCRTDLQRHNLAEKMPAVHSAYMIYRNASPALRYSVETRVLAAEPPEAIAGKTAVAPGVIAAFEALFYDLRPHLGHSDYIVAAIQGDVPGWDLHRICKLWAYRGGPLVADVLLQHSTAVEKPVDPTAVAAFLADDGRATAARAMALAARHLWAADPRSVAEFVRLQSQIASHGGEAATGSADPLREAFQQVLEQIGKSFRCLRPGEQELYGCVEPRAEEQLRMALGIEPPDLVALKDSSFPRRDDPQVAEPAR